MGFEYTKEQKQAIETRWRSLLVSAAAGSGKTRVLTERLLSYVAEGEDIDRFLVITYTRAAAAELRERISAGLAAMASAQPANAWLRRQQNLSCRAHIGTIHSFCSELIRDNCHVLGLSPAFRVLDEDRAGAMRESALDRLLEQRYENIETDGPFRQLCDTVGAGRDDSRLEKLVLSLHAKLQAHPDPAAWVREQIAFRDVQGLSDAGETLWGRELLSGLAESARYWRDRMAFALESLSAENGKLQKAFFESYSATAEALDRFLDALAAGWDRAAEALPVPFPRAVTPRNYPDQELAENLKAIRSGCKDAAQDWAEILSSPSKTLLAEERTVAPACQALLELTLDFDKAYAQAKKRAGELDFSDLEHFALELLTAPEGGPSDTARSVSRRFTEIMVDEYQDVNAVQERIFSAVSREGENLFLVGDVKQSIYRFRLADPGIFLSRYSRYPELEKDSAGTGGRLILLRENFRSRAGVLEGVNHVFRNIMSRALGDIDYDEAAALRCGAAGYPETGESAVQFYLIDPGSGGDGDEEDTQEKAMAEARFVAGKIAALMAAETAVTEGGIQRKCRWGDFAVLLRSPSAKGELFRQALEEAGIPASAGQGGFFASLEVTVAMSLLSVVDNPHADVPLISVLRSPVFGFDGDELSAVRAAAPEADFYTAVLSAAEQGDRRCRNFLACLSALRDAAPDLGTPELLRRVYDVTGLPALCAAMSAPEPRRANLDSLYELAQRFESGVGHGLHRFIRWLMRMAKRGEEPASSVPGNAVQIMSIHKSKGLEFPFVFLSDLSRRFNLQDTRETVLLHARLGLGPRLTDTRRGLEFPTLSRRAVGARILNETLSEEMRVLYVGMTRAKERLFLTCVRENAEKYLDKLRPGLVSPLPPELLRSASSPAHWLCSAALLDRSGLLDMRVVSAPAPGKAVEAGAGTPPEPEEEAIARLAGKLAFRYPWAAAENLPSKLTATGLEGRADDAQRMAEAESLAAEESPAAFRRPDLAAARRAAADRGTATHTVLRYIDFQKADSAGSVRREIQRLENAGQLTPDQAALADVYAVKRFGRSALCRRILSAQECRREFRFTLLCPASDYDENAPAGEELLLQGVTDCFIVENGQITVIDYKTDRVSAGEVPERAARYLPQLRAYAQALGRIRGLPVTECILYFLTPGVEYRVEIQ